MSITWKEGITTLAVAGAVALERAYTFKWDWPLLSSTRWALTGIAILFAVSYVFSYVLDKSRTDGWSFTANAIALAGALLVILGLVFTANEYVVALMIATVVFWVSAIVHRLVLHAPMRHGPMPV
jgi:hypothetical protein